MHFNAPYGVLSTMQKSKNSITISWQPMTGSVYERWSGILLKRGVNYAHLSPHPLSFSLAFVSATSFFWSKISHFSLIIVFCKIDHWVIRIARMKPKLTFTFRSNPISYLDIALFHISNIKNNNVGSNTLEFYNLSNHLVFHSAIILENIILKIWNQFQWLKPDVVCHRRIMFIKGFTPEEMQFFVEKQWKMRCDLLLGVSNNIDIFNCNIKYEEEWLWLIWVKVCSAAKFFWYHSRQ